MHKRLQRYRELKISKFECLMIGFIDLKPGFLFLSPSFRTYFGALKPFRASYIKGGKKSAPYVTFLTLYNLFFTA